MNHPSDSIPETRIPKVEFERRQLENIKALLEKINEQLMNAEDILDNKILSLFRLYSSYIRLYIQLDNSVGSQEQERENQSDENASSVVSLPKSPRNVASENHSPSPESLPQNPDKKIAAPVDSPPSSTDSDTREQNEKKQISQVNPLAGRTCNRHSGPLTCIPSEPAQSGLYAKAAIC
ncbi:MAG: hypothetical protein C4527_19710 [Candidatus Omnitrophota bacterium]|jgi:hypothetical protein|nr:MAG: hypothetical protein C4527_19710 [Candidatus Omnitrophota bacterium]